MKAKMEKAQSLLLIAVGMLALLGLTAIAIDGGNVYRDRRQAQNAADNAALAAALAITQNQDWQQAASTRASQNGYLNDGVRSVVEVYYPPVEGPYAGNTEYVQVIITSHVSTYFASMALRMGFLCTARSLATQ